MRHKMEPFRVRVTVAAAGSTRASRSYVGRLGTVVGESRDGRSWRVVLDGYRSIMTLHKGSMERVEGNDQ